MNWPCRVLPWGVLVPISTSPGMLLAQERSLVNVPETFSMRLTDAYLQTDVDVEHEVQSAGGAGSRIIRDRTLVEPTLGVGTAGWAYHPNLLEYTTQTAFGLGYQEARVTPGSAATDTQFLERYHVTLDVLKRKPYALGLSADRDFTYRDYDFFSRVRVDSERYGARSGYLDGPVPVSVSWQHYHEDISDWSRPSQVTEETVSLNANNLHRSDRGSAQAAYARNAFERDEAGRSVQRGLYQSVSLMDTEGFGGRDWVKVTSLLNYYSVTETVVPSEKLRMQERLQMQHLPSLTSFYDYEFDRTSSGPAEATTHQGHAGLNHQLYENLASTLDLHGLQTSAQAPANQLDTRRYGVGLSEQYTRALSSWGNISLGYAGGADREERSASGTVVQYLDESHTLTDGTLTLLQHPFVTAVSSVTDATGTFQYVEGSDYLVLRQGAMTEIRRVTGRNIPDGSTVLVDYEVVLEPSDSYSSFQHSGNFRLDFGHGLFGVYGRWTTMDFSGGEQLNLRWLDDRTIGVDTSWRWFRAGAEYEVVDSNLSPYDRRRFFQSLQFQPSDVSSLGFELDESWMTFRDTHHRQRTYGLISRYQHRLLSTVSWKMEGGFRNERGDSLVGDYVSVRSELDWAVGKLVVKLGYEYGSEQHPADERERHRVYLRARRSF